MVYYQLLNDMFWIIIFALFALFIKYRRILFLLWIYAHSYSFFTSKDTIYIPVLLERTLFYIPIKKRNSRFFLLDSLSEYDNRAVAFLNNFTCKIDESTGVKIFDFMEFREKIVPLSDI